MRASKLLTGGLVLVLAAGCASDSRLISSSARPDGSDDVLVRTGEGFTALAIDGEEAIPTATGSVASPDRSALYGSTSGVDGNDIRAFATWTGERLSRFTSDEGLEPAVVSGSGRYLALTEPRGPGATPWLPDARTATTIGVVDPERPDSMRTFDLRGNFEPEAFATDDRQLFMIEYIPAMAPDRYRVRRLNLRTGAVSPIGRTKLSAPEQMRGTGRMQVLSPDGEQLYTLYTQQDANYTHGEPEHHSPGQTHAFVHVLNLRYGWAHCIDLPMPFGMGRATASALDVSRDGRRIFVSDWTNGALSVIDTRRLRVRKTVVLDLGAADDSTFTRTSDDALYIAGNRTVVVVDPEALGVTGRWSFPDEVNGIAVASDGRSLFVGQDDAIAVVERDSGVERLRFRVPGIVSIEHVLR